MNFAKIEKSITGAVKEQQIKLGYLSEKVRLYYPLTSLNRLLGKECSIEQMQECLKEYAESVADKYGNIEITNVKDRFCILIPEQGSDYIHECIGEDKFLVEFIEAIRQHGSTFEDILVVFQKYSDKVHVEKIENGEFDYLISFEDGNPDDFIYCLNVHENHIIYHRFTPDDYIEFLE